MNIVKKCRKIYPRFYQLIFIFRCVIFNLYYNIFYSPLYPHGKHGKRGNIIRSFHGFHKDGLLMVVEKGDKRIMLIRGHFILYQ